MPLLDPNEYIGMIDISGLENALEKVTGVSIKLELTISTRIRMGGRREHSIAVSSEELSDSVGAMRASFREVYINNNHSGSKLYIMAGRVEWQTRLGFEYKFKDGGSNGCQILTAAYRFDNHEWEITAV